MKLEFLLKELNPKYDMFKYNYDNFHFNDLCTAIANQGKSLIRGGIVGGILGLGAGSLYNLISGEDFLKSADYSRTGFSLGASIDLFQYVFRFCWYAIKRI